MNLSIALLLIPVLGVHSSVASSELRARQLATQKCNNPKKAVLDLLACVGNIDANCAAAAYDPSFQRFHNEIQTTQDDVTNVGFWQGAFTFFPSFSFDIKFAMNAGQNKASVRYIETVTSTNFGDPNSTTYPFAQTVAQHEHAIVEVNNDCKLTKWDQYGDNQEQSDLDDISAALLQIVGGRML